MALTVTRLSDALGCEVEGVDLGTTLEPAAFEAIERAWLDHQVVLIRGQALDSTRQIAFCANFGTVQNQVARVQGGMDTDNDAVLYVSNLRDDAILPEGEMWFHTDQCYFEVPTIATCLYAIEIPAEGGNTRFANTYAAYDCLPEATRNGSRGDARSTSTTTCATPASAKSRHGPTHRASPTRWCAPTRAPGARHSISAA